MVVKKCAGITFLLAAIVKAAPSEFLRADTPEVYRDLRDYEARRKFITRGRRPAEMIILLLRHAHRRIAACPLIKFTANLADRLFLRICVSHFAFRLDSSHPCIYWNN